VTDAVADISARAEPHLHAPAEDPAQSRMARAQHHRHEAQREQPVHGIGHRQQGADRCVPHDGKHQHGEEGRESVLGVAARQRARESHRAMARRAR
jgi:hypothetical protein